MKKPALILLSLLLVGCSASPNESTGSDTQPSPTATVSPSSRPTFEVSDAATCQTLLGTDGGLVAESGQFLTDITELDDQSAAEAIVLADALQGVADTTSEQFRNLLTVMQEPFRDLVEASESGDAEFDLEPSRFKAAANEVIALCEPLLEADASTSSGFESSPPSALKVSEETTCTQLAGVNQDGPLFETATFMAELDGSSDITATVDRARVLSEDLRGIAQFAQDDMALLLDEFVLPLDEIIGLADGTQSEVTYDINAWKAAGTELVTICESYDSGL